MNKKEGFYIGDLSPLKVGELFQNWVNAPRLAVIGCNPILRSEFAVREAGKFVQCSLTACSVESVENDGMANFRQIPYFFRGKQRRKEP